MQQMRRVRTVRLAAPEEALVRRGAILLEDALHVASLPGTDGGRLLVIRSLQLGRINVLQPSMSAALTIEERVRALAGAAVHAEDPAANAAPAVYFRDEAEPFILLATRLARQASTDTWFWPLAIPAWRNDMGRDEALRAVLYGSAETRVGAAGAVALIGELHRRHVIEPLLSALRWADGHQLMRVCGWRAPSGPFAPSSPGVPGHDEAIAPIWVLTLARWAAQWGDTDARTLWLTAIALAVEKPARLLDDRLVRRAQRILRTVVASSIRDNPDDGSAPSGRAGQTPYGQTVYKVRTGSDERNLDEADSYARLPAQTQSRGLSDSRAVEPRVTVDIDPEGPHDGAPSARSLDEPDILSDAPQRHVVPDRPHQARKESRPTTYAGLFLLLPVMSRLGMAEMLTSYPDLLDLDLPDRIVREVARRSGVPLDDPVMAAPATIRTVRTPQVGEFVVPGRWSPTLCADGAPRLRRVRGHAHRRVLYDASGRLPLALWQGRAPDAARLLLAGSTVRRDPRIVRRAGIALAVDAWVVALRRWCRLYSGLSLRALVQRPGSISLTRTHLDVRFDLRSVDIRIRKAGIDLDPGWVPWLGRVVSFHYRQGEDDDGTD
jgi:hypothetical protein